MIYLLYTLVIFAATCLGAVAGLGGGVIIKPVLDLVGYHDVASIGIYSSCAVFAMCVVSLVRRLRSGFDFDRTVVAFVSVGSLAGGLVGEKIFSLAVQGLPQGTVKALQAGLLAVTLGAVLVYVVRQERMPQLRLASPVAIFAAGLGLGVISVFLGIGGGPLNVACMTLLFSFGMKEATVYSLATIFFSQVSKLGMNALTGTLFAVGLGFMPVVVVPAVVGGLVGTRLSQSLDDDEVRTIYLTLLWGLLATSAFNCARALIL